MTLARLIEAVERGDENGVSTYYASRVFPVGFAHVGNAFRGDLNAAKLFHDMLLPGWWATMRYSTRPLVTVGDVDEEFQAQDDYLARAWLLAILRAMEGRG